METTARKATDESGTRKAIVARSRLIVVNKIQNMLDTLNIKCHSCVTT